MVYFPNVPALGSDLVSLKEKLLHVDGQLGREPGQYQVSALRKISRSLNRFGFAWLITTRQSLDPL